MPPDAISGFTLSLRFVALWRAVFVDACPAQRRIRSEKGFWPDILLKDLRLRDGADD
jgi:hypothetical protein